MTQTSIDFSKRIVHKENNPESQDLFDSNEPVFRGQCKKIMEAFNRGEKLTTRIALLKYNIGDLRRRIKDLKDNYNVKNIQEKVKEGGFKEWSIKN